ncbi:hypothetical protein DK254_03110 [Pseudomonas sp. RW407]|nr:hypothetical protein DK254_03110 [Pseudomonas sp. RW407]
MPLVGFQAEFTAAETGFLKALRRTAQREGWRPRQIVEAFTPIGVGLFQLFGAGLDLQNIVAERQADWR